jgi:hypothetical protein
VNTDHAQPHVDIRDIFPSLPGAELKEAEENLSRYFKVALQIYEVMEHTPTVLDASLASPKMEERSNPSLKI